MFSFGWGLSYAQFNYSHITASKQDVSVTVTNIGRVAGAEVAELYLGLDAATNAMPRVEHALAGFEKVMLNPGESTRITFPLKPEQLTVVDLNGARQPATGAVSVAVAGHLPSDPRAQLATNQGHVSNVALSSFNM